MTDHELPEGWWEDHSPIYRTIVADPPWSYDKTNPDKSGEGYEGREGLPYSGMSLEAIRGLPVAQLAHPEGCRLFLWTTNYYLRHAWSVVEAWGFEAHDRVLVWCKKPRATTPVTTEFILIAKRGRPRRMPWHGTTWFDWEHQAAHSVKPAGLYDLVQGWCEGPYLEMFARQQRFGWDSWGRGVETEVAS